MDTEADLLAAALKRRTRAQQLAGDISDLVNDVVERLEEMSGELDMTAAEILDLVRDHVTSFPHQDIAWHAWAQMFPAAALKKGMPMERVIGRLFEEAPKLEDASGKNVPRQAPALPQVQVALKGGMLLSGAMSTTPEGTLRIMAPAKDPETNRAMMIESFFDYTDVATIQVPREMPKIADRPRIIGARD